MKPIEKIAEAKTPDGGSLLLTLHDGDYSISIERQELMNSRQHESELELARLACAKVASARNPRVLIGGLGMGYTLRQTLDMLAPGARVTVAELIPEIVAWNRRFFGGRNGHPLQDKRVTLEMGDVVELIEASRHGYDAIMLDVDNGPWALTDAGNERLYSRDGVQSCWNALTARGVLAVWSAGMDRQFGRLLDKCGFQARYFRAPSYKGARSFSRCIWVASKDGYVQDLYQKRVGNRTKQRNGKRWTTPKNGTR